LELAVGRFPYPDDLDNPVEPMVFIVRGGEVSYTTYMPNNGGLNFAADPPTVGWQNYHLEPGDEELD
jgi:hypothetical protein